MFVLGFKEFLGDKKQQRANKRQSITKQRTIAEEELEAVEEDRITLARSGTLDEEAKLHLVKKRKKIQDELDQYNKDRKELDKDFDETLVTFTYFLELSANAHKYWIAANLEQKKKITEIMILNLVAKDAKTVSITYKEPFQKWVNRAKSGVVEHIGFEPMTPCMPCKCSSQLS